MSSNTMKLAACKWLFVIWLCVFNIPLAWSSPATHWQSLAPGLAYARLEDFPTFPQGYLHAFRIDLAHYQLRVSPVVIQPLSAQFAQLYKTHQALLVVNGGFFVTRVTGLTSLGLRIDQYNVLSPPRKTKWWDIFYIKNQHAYIVPNGQFSLTPAIDFALQAGPRLIVDRRVASILKAGSDARTAVCIQSPQQIVIVATENVLLSTQGLAEIFQRTEAQGGLNCQQALNLDGGHSTQLYAQIGDFSLQVLGYSRVADMLWVSPRADKSLPR